MDQPKGGLLLALVAAGGVVVGAVVTGAVNYLGHQHDLDAKMIELSVGILRAEPTPETAPLREWAIDVIDKRARFSFDAAQRKALLQEQLPFGGSDVIGMWDLDPKKPRRPKDKVK
jgi:hypothetical protein